MMTRLSAAPITCLLTACLLAAPALANDTMAELKTGGITYVETLDVTMEEEDLFISPAEVRVNYVFANDTDRDIHTVVAFPMPEVTGGPEQNIAVYDPNSDNMLGFTVSQDGKSITPELQQRATANGVDITGDLIAHKIPLLPLSEATNKALNALADDVRQDFFDRGIAMDSSYDGGEGMQRDTSALWTMSSVYWWRTTFPAHSRIKVAHTYKPSVGGTVATTYLDENNEGKGERYEEYVKRFCIDDAMVKIARQSNEAMASGKPYFMENWISYVLKTGANWGGTIKKFKLTVDKGRPENYVSFCGTGVKKVGPTSFEMTAEDFFPEKDLDILLLAKVDNTLQP